MAARLGLRVWQPNFLHYSRVPCCLCSRRKQTSSEQVSRKENIDSKTLFVKNFPASFKEEQFKELSVDLKGVRLRKSHHAKTPVSYAFLEFESEEKAKKNLELLKEQEVEGTKLVVNYAKQPEENVVTKEIDPLQLHVVGLERGQNREDCEGMLRGMFPEASEIDVRLTEDQKSMGFGFIHFKTTSQCEVALARIQGKHPSITVVPARKTIELEKKERKPKQRTTELQQQDDTKRRGKRDIVIPKRKKRDATAILKALSSTVGHDPLAAHYSFIDDPFTLPPYHELQRIYALSKAAGRRTARFMMNEFHEALTHDDAAPHIKAYDPDITEYVHTEPTEEALIERIDLRRVTHAIEVYKTMQRLGTEVSPPVLQSFLELICLYNHEDSQSFYPEERRFLRPRDLDNITTWQGNCLAEQVFKSLPEKTAEAYNALIRGMFMHKNEARAFKFYEEMKENNLPVFKETYIQMLEGAAHVYNLHKGRLEDHPDRGQRYWDLVVSLLKEMKSHRIPPCQETFNAVLKSLTNARVSMKLDRLDSVLNEMHRLGIEPTLESWGHVLLCTATGGRKIPQVTTHIKTILKEIKKKPIEVKKFEDAQFFMAAMIEIHQHTNSTELAMELHEMRESLGSILPSGRSQDDFMYYKHFLQMLIQTEPAETVLREYSKIVPYVYVPDVDTFCAIVDCLKLHSALEYIPQIWEDVCFIVFKYFDKVAAHIFAILAETKHDKQEEFIKMSDQIFFRWQEAKQFRTSNGQRNGNHLQRNGNVINGQTFGFLIEIALNSDDLDRAWTYFSAYKESVNDFQDRPGDRAYEALFKACFGSRDPEKIMTVVNLMNEQAVPNLYRLIEEVKQELDTLLDDTQRSVVDRL